MSKSIGDKPAYPTHRFKSDGSYDYLTGLTLREVLIVAAVNNSSICYSHDCKRNALWAIKQADAVIAALEKEQGK